MNSLFRMILVSFCLCSLWVTFLLDGFGASLDTARSQGLPVRPTRAETGGLGGEKASGFDSQRDSVFRGQRLYASRVISSGKLASVHSATAIEIENGELLVVWYGGSREGASDVSLYASRFIPKHLEWTKPEEIVTRASTQTDLSRYIKKLGNPVLYRESTSLRGREGRIWLFYVSVSLGGWSGSAINARVSDDKGLSWGSAKRFITSPFLNLSTLIRGPVVTDSKGYMRLPVYHEFLGKFSELLTIDPLSGGVMNKVRLTSGRSAIQPVLVNFGNGKMTAFMRKTGSSPSRISVVSSDDGGNNWGPISFTSLRNPDAAIFAHRTRKEEVLLAFNDSERDRNNLRLAISMDDGQSFKMFHTVKPPRTEDRSSRLAYPWIVQTFDGNFHLFYTWNRKHIVHVMFNRLWLEEQF